jgi:sporulation protein YlmC with PRC-barrel domain
VYVDHLKELHSSEYEMASGEPDIRNWKVVGLQNREVGKVEELLFNEVSHRVRYLIVNINGKPLNLISRSILIPVGMVDLLKDEKVVLLNGLSIGHLASLPTYEKGKISRETELEIRDVFSPGYASVYRGTKHMDDEEFYDHEYFNNGRFAHPRMEVTERNSVKEEIRENLERVKESVKKMENEVEKMNGPGL